MTKIKKITLRLGGFKYDKALEINIRYYHTRLNKNASNRCTSISPW